MSARANSARSGIALAALIVALPAWGQEATPADAPAMEAPAAEAPPPEKPKKKRKKEQPAPADLTQAERDAIDTAAPLPKGSDVAAPPPAAQAEAAPPAPVLEEAAPEPAIADPLDDAIIDGRRRPGPVQREYEPALVQDNPGAIRPPPPEAFPEGDVALPDRWRLVQSLCPDRTFRAAKATCGSIFDPYHQNFFKGDRPINPKDVPFGLLKGDDWFLIATAISDTVVEPRSFPTPVGVQTTDRPGSLDVFGKSNSFLAAQTVLAGLSLVKGSTAYKPPEIEYRFTIGAQYNYVDVNEKRILNVRSTRPTYREDAFVGLQEAFVDYHIRNTSERYDFDSIRVGVQPFQADFRGFLFNDNQLGVRLFGTRDNNRFQYNLAAFWRIEKDTNTGLNDPSQPLRRDWVFHANVYRQDLPVPGFTSELSVTYNRNREGDRVTVDHNGFPARPALLGDIRGRNYDVTYIGYNGDGHIDRLNLTASAYFAIGQDRNSFFTSRPAEIRSWFVAFEPSYDIDWVRIRGAALWQSGDGDPYNNVEGGFDAIFENPIFAGADTSYWIRQTIPFAGGGRAVFLNQRNGLLVDLRSSKEQGQSNFNNPGLILLGVGADFDVTPRFRVSANANHLQFAQTETLEELRSEGSIPQEIGWDLSVAAIWRPKQIQNVVVRASVAVLEPGDGFRDLFTQSRDNSRYVSGLLNVILSY